MYVCMYIDIHMYMYVCMYIYVFQIYACVNNYNTQNLR